VDRYAAPSFRLTPRARELLRPGEALVLEWHRLAVCCAGAGETSLSVMKEEVAKGRGGLVRLSGPGDEALVYAARAIAPHLAGHEVVFDAGKVLGLRRFVSDLPGDFGLRSIFGRLPRGEGIEGSGVSVPKG
jgi:hypothetical protein